MKADLRSTYRLQFNRNFTFQDAIELVPYLKKLNISHCYASPLLQAAKGSLHGYDIVNYHRLNPEIGSLEEFKELIHLLRKHQMGLIFDFLPNHMYILDPANIYWYDVLKNGKKSKYAHFFDIDWTEGKIILPLLETKNQDPKLIIDRFQFPPSDHYELIFYKEGNSKVNYRRLFDNFQYAALRVEDPEVFKEIHSFVFQLIDEGLIDGLRIDHIDGLWDPEAYLNKLHRRCPFLLVEKILLDKEKLRPSWPVQGTVGYEFLNLAGALFVDSKKKDALLKNYRDFTGQTTSAERLVYECKCRLIDTSFQSELKRLAKLHPDLSRAIKDTAASFPVYRTYISSAKKEIDEEDKNIILDSIKNAQANSAASSPEELKSLKELLLLKTDKTFAQNFQKITPPVAVKGLEDTALYNFFPLLSLNEVGYGFSQFGSSLQDFHDRNLETAQKKPYTLLASSTHDTKRSEDVRSRIHVLSEIPEEWNQMLCHWSNLNKKPRRIPDPNEEYFLYQTLIGTWPFEKISREYIDRIQQYMKKAIREEKTHSNWLNPDESYHRCVELFIEDLFENSAFLQSMEKFVRKIAPFGMLNSLSALILKLTSPGSADFYQGNEIWNLSLVDPDNRRPIDFNRLKENLSSLPDSILPLLKTPEDGKIKLFITCKALELRERHPQVFLGSYKPVIFADERLIGFYRESEKKKILVLTTRFFTTFMNGFSSYLHAPWKDISMPSGTFVDIFTKKTYTKKQSLQDALSPLPFAILESL